MSRIVKAGPFPEWMRNAVGKPATAQGRTVGKIVSVTEGDHGLTVDIEVDDATDLGLVLSVDGFSQAQPSDNRPG